MLAEDVICSGDATGPDEAKAAKFVNALLADPQSSANVLNGWSKPRGATQSPQDRRNMNAVRVALDDPNIAQRVRTELDASQPGGPALAEAASSMLRSAPRTAVEAQLQVRQCPAVEEQFSQRLGDAAREVANARSFAEKQQAISVFRGTLFADPESARNVLGGKAGAIVNRNDPARTRMSQQRNSENNAAARQALQDPAVRQDIHAFVMGRESQLQGSRAGEMAQAARQVALYRDVVAPKMQVATAVVGKSVAG
jgi:hypothetical protein